MASLQLRINNIEEQDYNGQEDITSAIFRLNPNEALTNNKLNYNNIDQNLAIDCNNNSSQMANDTPMRMLKKMGWYYGPIDPEFAAKLLEDEQDGSFLVRDSNDPRYLFSLTYRLDGKIHHTRIVYSQGEYSFGRSHTKFHCTTIVDFIEKAIAYSQNEELLFFLHREPDMEGPVRFKMIPLSRLKCGTGKSLKNMCRFAILEYVRRDRINELSVPSCLIDYLHEAFQYTF